MHKSRVFNPLPFLGETWKFTVIEKCKITVEERSNIQPEHCTCDDGCVSACINRSTHVECTHHKCTNRSISDGSKFKNYLIPFETKYCGLGLQARCEIPKDSFIIEYIGERISVEEYEKRWNDRYSALSHFYGCQVDNIVIDSTKFGNYSRLMNHSCDPNCRVEKWIVGGRVRLGIFSIRAIEEEEELTWYYDFSTMKNSEKPKECQCESKKCKGVIGKSSVQDLKKCSKCGLRFGSSDSRRFHQRFCGLNFPCMIEGCDVVYARWENFRKHLKKSHPDVAIPKPATVAQVVEKKRATKRARAK